MRGYTAIMLDKKGGGLVNAAIVSVGMREGAQSKEDVSRPVVLPAETQAAGAIPREQRLAMFLEKTTQELDNMAVEANAANRAKSEFLSMMSHEIRTPINAVLGMNEMVLRECDDENVMTYAENAHAAGLSLLGIINEILDFSKIEAGKMEIVPQEYELASLISDLVNLIRMKAEERGLSLYVKVAPDYLLEDDLTPPEASEVKADGSAEISGTYHYVVTPGEKRTEAGAPVDWTVEVTGGEDLKETLNVSVDEFSTYFPAADGIVWEVDVNFDGNPDVLLFRGALGAQGAEYYDCWLSDGKKLTRCEDFENVPNPDVDGASKMIYGHIRDGAAAYYELLYRIEGNKTVMTEETRYVYDEEKEDYVAVEAQ